MAAGQLEWPEAEGRDATEAVETTDDQQLGGQLLRQQRQHHSEQRDCHGRPSAAQQYDAHQQTEKCT